MTHLKFDDISDMYPSRKKTKTFAVFSLYDATELGQVEWYTKWRQYIFTPTQVTSTVWSTDCLDELSLFIKELMTEWKYDRK